MSKLDEARTRVDALKAEIRGLADKETLEEAEETRFAAALEEGKVAVSELTGLEERAKAVAAIEAKTTDRVPGADVPGQINRTSPFGVDPFDSSRGERRDAAMKVLESTSVRMSARQQDRLDHLLRKGQTANFDSDYIARRALITESDAYHSAFAKGITGDTFWTADEVRALQAYRKMESRAGSEGTMGAGGYGVPILIDPTIVLTSGALDAPILSISRIETITTDQWKGVTSQGMTFEYTAEAAAVADKTPTLAQPTIPVYRADGFIPYSFEIGQDYPGFAEEMGALLDQGYVNLVAAGTMTSSGTGCPTGVFTALKGAGNKCADATSGTVVTVTTLGSLGAVDVRACWSSLGELFRQHSTWVMNVSVESVVRAFGNGLALSDFTIDLTQPGESRLAGRPVVLSDYAPTFSNTTALANQYAILGDFSKFMIVQRAGMVVEQVPHLFSVTTGYPTGQRGWLAWSRHGYNALSGNPFRILSNGT
jgi:HK97 family phage major capsid protein